MDALLKFEKRWEKASIYFTDSKKCNQFLNFSERLEAIAEKHPSFGEQIMTRDAEIFLSIPCLLVLMAIDSEDKNLCRQFCPEMFTEGTTINAQFNDLKQQFEGKCIEEDFELYNILEKTILEIEHNESEKARLVREEMKIEQILQKLRSLAMHLSRTKPQDWN